MNPFATARGFVVDLWRLPLMFQLVLLWMVGAGTWQWWKRRKVAETLAASVSWPIYKARVVWAQVSDRKKEGRHGDYYSEGLLTYSYTVPGHELEVGEYRKRFEDDAEAEAWVRGLRDSFVEVRVDPADAKRSVWQETGVMRWTRADDRASGRTPSAVPEFWGVRDFDALVVCGASTIGLVLATWILFTALEGNPAVTAEKQTGAFFGMHIGAMVCGAWSQAIAKRRRQNTRQGATEAATDGYFAKLLGGCMIALFFYGWVKGAANDANPSQWGVIMFSAIWLAIYFSSATACWKVLQRSQVVDASRG